jgi:hypothetical protein
LNRQNVIDALGMVVTSCEVQEILMVNRSRLSVLVQSGKLIPVKETKSGGIFYLPDVMLLKQVMSLDTRSNLYKMAARH